MQRDRPLQYMLAQDRVLAPSGEHWARVTRANPLEEGFPETTRLIAWSGWYGEEADPAAGVFPRDFRTWTPAAWSRLRERLDAWSAAASPMDALILRTLARHLLSDAQACSILLRDCPDERIHILLDPVAMLEPAMLPDVEDHIARILDLAQWPLVSGVVIAGAQLVDGDILPTHAGTVLSRPALEILVNRFAPAAARFFLS